MSNIKIISLNETYLKIDAERSVLQELNDYFTITIPNSGYRKIGSYKNWNGKLKLFKIRDRIIYKGLLAYVEAFAKEKSYTIDYDKPANKNISLFEVEQAAKTLGLPFEPKDYQITYVTQALRKKRITIVSPVGSGKSLIMYLLCRFLYKKRILIIVPITNLVEQLYTDFRDYGYDSAKHCHRIYSGHEKITDKRIIISTWQSLATLPPEWFKDIGVVIGDECHTCSAKDIQGVIGNCLQADYRIGLTGTLQDTKSHKLTIEGLFGPSYQEVTTKELIDRGDLSSFEIKCILLNHENPIMKWDYRAELEYVISLEQRNLFIRNLAMSLKDNTLILYDFVEKHGRILEQMLHDVNKEGRKKVLLVCKDNPAEEVQEIRAMMEKETNVILLASYMKFKMGFNIKNLHNIIFATAGKARIKTLQSIGRELRVHPNKDKAILFDIADNIKAINSDTPNYILKHFGERVRMYNDEKFDWKMYKVSLRNENSNHLQNN